MVGISPSFGDWHLIWAIIEHKERLLLQTWWIRERLYCVSNIFFFLPSTTSCLSPSVSSTHIIGEAASFILPLRRLWLYSAILALGVQRLLWIRHGDKIAVFNHYAIFIKMQQWFCIADEVVKYDTLILGMYNCVKCIESATRWRIVGNCRPQDESLPKHVTSVNNEWILWLFWLFRITVSLCIFIFWPS